MKQCELDKMFLEMALLVAKQSKAIRSCVGGILVKDSNIISFGWNGQPHGFPNKCEDDDNKTLPTVIHAEMNIFGKLARSGTSSNNSTIYLTLSPCFECSKLIIQAGTKRVVYINDYRDLQPLEFLRKAGILVEKYLI